MNTIPKVSYRVVPVFRLRNVIINRDETEREQKMPRTSVSDIIVGGEWDLISNDESAKERKRNLVFGGDGGNLHWIGIQIGTGRKKNIESW
jgi:hypothetical protein